MSGKITVSPEVAAQIDALRPNLDTGTGIFSLSTESDAPWTAGFDIDGLVLFDCDENRWIRNVDLLIPWKRLKLSQVELPSTDGPTCALQCDSAVLEHQSLRLSVVAERDGNTVRIGFSETSESGIVVRIAPNAAVRIDDGCLIEIFATL